MFILYAVGIGIAIGALTGGRLDRLASLRIRAWPVAVAGLIVQLVLFSPLGADLAGQLGPVLYVGSTAAVLLVVLLNVRIPGLALVAAGAALNLAAIVANGGRMPADPAALASLGASIGDGYSNSVVLPDPALRPLTDVFAMPAWLPLANVFSIGDVLIGVGVAIAIAVGMRGAPVREDTA